MFLKFWEYLNIPRTWEECLTTLQQMNFLAKWIGTTEEKVNANTTEIEAINDFIDDIDIPAENRLVPEDGTVGQVLKKTATGSAWANESGGGGGLPSGGTKGQVLTKTADAEGYAGWRDSYPRIISDDETAIFAKGEVTEKDFYMSTGTVKAQNFSWDETNKIFSFDIYNPLNIAIPAGSYIDEQLRYIVGQRTYNDDYDEWDEITFTPISGITGNVILSNSSRFYYSDAYAIMYIEDCTTTDVIPALSVLNVQIRVTGLVSVQLPLMDLTFITGLPYRDGDNVTQRFVVTTNGKEYYLMNAYTLPSGGFEGYVLTKTSDTAGACEWREQTTPETVTYPLTEWAGDGTHEPTGLYNVRSYNSYHQVIIDGLSNYYDETLNKTVYTITLKNTGGEITSANPMTEVYTFKADGNIGYDYSNVSSDIRDIRTIIGEYIRMEVKITALATDGFMTVSFSSSDVNIPVPYTDESEYVPDYQMGRQSGMVYLIDTVNYQPNAIYKDYEPSYNRDMKIVNCDIDNDNGAITFTLKNMSDYAIDSMRVLNLEFNGNIESIDTITPSTEQVTKPYENVLRLAFTGNTPLQAGDTTTITVNFTGQINYIMTDYVLNLVPVVAQSA